MMDVIKMREKVICIFFVISQTELINVTEKS